MHEVKITTDGKLNKMLRIRAMDEEDPVSGACSKYQIDVSAPQGSAKLGRIEFHKGSLTAHLQTPAVQPNGVSLEAVLEVCLDRLRCLQAGQLSCTDNMHAMVHIQEALLWLNKRTRERIERGVEGIQIK